MGAFDRAAKYAAQTEPIAVVDRLLRDTGHFFTFGSWCESQPQSKPDDDERIPDLVASLDEVRVPPRKWLLVMEFQAQTDESKLRVTL